MNTYLYIDYEYLDDENSEENRCDSCGQWTNPEDLEEFGDDIDLCYLCPHCYDQACTIQLEPHEM